MKYKAWKHLIMLNKEKVFKCRNQSDATICFYITDTSLIKHKAVVIKFINGIKSIACCTKFLKSFIEDKVCSTRRWSMHLKEMVCIKWNNTLRIMMPCEDMNVKLNIGIMHVA